MNDYNGECRKNCLLLSPTNERENTEIKKGNFTYVVCQKSDKGGIYDANT